LEECEIDRNAKFLLTLIYKKAVSSSKCNMTEMFFEIK